MRLLRLPRPLALLLVLPLLAPRTADPPEPVRVGAIYPRAAPRAWAGSTSTTVSGSRPSWSTRTAASTAARSCSTRSTCPRPTPPRRHQGPGRPGRRPGPWQLRQHHLEPGGRRRGRPRLAVLGDRGGRQLAGPGSDLRSGSPPPAACSAGAPSASSPTSSPWARRPASSLRFAIAAVDDVYGHASPTGPGPSCATAGWRPRPTWPTTRAATTRPRWSRRSRPPGPTCCSWSPTLEDGAALRREQVRQHLPLLASIGTSSSYCMPEFGALLGRDAVGLFASDKFDTHGINPSKPAPTPAPCWTGSTPPTRRPTATR